MTEVASRKSMTEGELAVLASFSVLALLALVTLLVKTTLEWRTRRELEEHKRMLTLGGEA